MPKLNKATAKRVGDAEGSSFEALPEGRYLLQLREVTVGEGNAGPYWSWEFQVKEDYDSGEECNQRVWVNTSLSEKADWKMKETFEAFGVAADTDTDELVGEQVVGYVSQRLIERGNRAGQMGNNVDRLVSIDAAEGGEGGDEEVF